MKVLIIKMSSMGDLIHTLPALTDAALNLALKLSKLGESVSFDWVVEEGFAEIPAWHPGIHKVIPIGLRRWRKNLFKTNFLKQTKEILQFVKNLRAEKYDLVIDAQGLFKSALVGRLARTTKSKKLTFFGTDKDSAREGGASFFYGQKISVPKGLHAITRTRILFSKIFDYALDPSGLIFPDYGLRNVSLGERGQSADSNNSNNKKPFVLFLHGTTWESKHWPEKYWAELAQKVLAHGWDVYLPWGSLSERDRAVRICNSSPPPSDSLRSSTSPSEGGSESLSGQILVLEKLKLTDLAHLLQQATYVVGVDSGLAHLAAALNCRAITLFGPTDSLLTGPLGRNQLSLQANFECSPCFLKKCSYPLPHAVSPPCFGQLYPGKVWEKILKNF
jgi:heptosyltransferase-1